MEKQYCDFGKNNKCPYLIKCFDEGVKTSHIISEFEEIPMFYSENSEVLSWIHYEKKDTRKRISCIERIIIKERL
jgi:hypothetical protein